MDPLYRSRRRWLFLIPLCLLFASTRSAAETRIDLNGFRFDPLYEEPQILPILRATDSEGRQTYLVQFSGPVEESWKEEVSEYGVTFHGYVPEFAFIARIDSASIDPIQRLRNVRWVGRFHTAYRISPEIGRMRFRNPERAGDPRLTLRVTVAEELEETIAQAGSLGEVLDPFEDFDRDGFVIRIDPADLVELASIGTVLWVEELPETFLLNNTTRWVIQSNQAAQTPIWSRGIFGDGELLCMMDSGLDYNSCWFREYGNAPPGPSHRKVVDYREWGGGNAYDGCDTGHGTHVAGTAIGDQSYINNGNTNYNGMAYKAKIMVQDVGGDGWLECLFGLISVPSSLTSAFNDAYANGARVHTNSWGSTSNSYDGYCVNIDSFMWNHRDFLVLFANGNSGPGGGTVGSPATAKNCVSVGATKQSPNQETIAGYSSRGPTSDGRTKPTVTAPGGESPTYINSADNNSGDPPSPTCNVQGNPFQGTSMATPAVAGAALLVRDYFAQGFYPNGAAGGEAFLPSAALVKAMLINGGKDMGGGDQPNQNEGWGRILLEDALHFEGDTRELRIEDEAVGVATGEEFVYVYDIDATSEPLEVVLVWTDYPATQGANPALVNDLNLTVTSPDGSTYKGNVYSGGQSMTGGAYDFKNVEECLRRSAPTAGAWTISVRGQNVPQGVHQPFALVSSGSFGGWPEDPTSAGDLVPLAGTDLLPARPNPFSVETLLTFVLPVKERASLAVYDTNGRLLRRLGEIDLTAGTHQVAWDGLDRNGNEVANGIYFYRLETESTRITRKVVRLH